jgi:Arc/MetJ-type ribon-helix-helix transcriptional regulator
MAKTVNISLPPARRAWLESRRDTGGYTSTSDVVQDLIRQAQEAEQERLRHEFADLVEKGPGAAGTEPVDVVVQAARRTDGDTALIAAVLDKAFHVGKAGDMRTVRLLVLLAILAVPPVCVFADGTVSPPNPAGEKLYSAQLLARMLPIAIIVCGLLLSWLIYAVRRKAKTPAPDDRESQHC